MNELSKEVVLSQLPKHQRNLVSENEIKEINKLVEDPDYGPEFLSSYLDHMKVLHENVRNNHAQYVNAVKFFTLVESNHSLKDAYIKVFPERYEERCRRSNDPDASINAEASRFNKSGLVNKVREMAAVPIQLIYRHVLHEAIIESANLMRTARSEMVRQRAAATIISELKPQEDTVINVRVDDGSKSAIEELHEATKRLAAAERQSVQAGVPMRDIAESNIIEGEYEEDVD